MNPCSANRSPSSCPLNPANIHGVKWGCLQELKDIQLHLSKGDCQCQHPVLKDLELSGGLQGSTPLLIACHDGDPSAVKLIVEVWGADVNKAGVFYSGDDAIEGASPLFVAASQRHEDIVLYLCAKGADISARTTDASDEEYEGMTILQAAVHFPRLSVENYTCARQSSIVNFLVERGADPSAVSANGYPTWFYGLSKLQCTIQLIELGMDLSHRCPHFNRTALHYWASSSNLSSVHVVQLLLTKGLRLNSVDYHGLTPLLLAAIGNVTHFPNRSILKYLLPNQHGIPLNEVISALELAGSELLSFAEGPSLITEGLDLWKLALRLRWEHRLVKHVMPIAFATVEFTTIEQLEELRKNPVEIRLQSFLVRQRILSNISLRAVCYYQWSVIESYLEFDDDSEERIGLRLDLCCIMLNSGISKLDEDECWTEIVLLVQQIVTSLLKLKNMWPSSPFLNAEVLLWILNLVILTDRHHLTDFTHPSVYFEALDTHVIHMETVCWLISLLASVLPNNEEDVLLLLRWLVRRNGKQDDGWTWLHVACSMPKFDSSPVVRLLLLADSDPNASDEQGNTPLHLAATTLKNTDVSEAHRIASQVRTVQLLLRANADLHRVNKSDKKAVYLLEKAYAKHDIKPTWHSSSVLSLAQLSANLIRRSGIRYQGEVPTSLYATIQLK